MREGGAFYHLSDRMSDIYFRGVDFSKTFSLEHPEKEFFL